LPDLICDTSPIQYLHQLGILDVLHALANRVLAPPAVVSELAEGRALGVALPDLRALHWIEIRRPISALSTPLVTNLGPGETQVLMLGLECREAVVVLDDALARRIAETLGLPLTGTLGVLLDAKRAGLIPAVNPMLDQLQALRFRLAPHTRAAILDLAEESP
jgi:uncharacterized protein